MSDPSDEIAMHFVQQVVDGLLARCDRMGMVCDVTITIRRKDGSRVVHMDGHGKHEVDGE